ncbi:MAG TPA: antibiotic biosynthesis monooxygenase [Acidimicrobiales bacterium]|nr:antibiotic biosynthesis monooxygenase [Acidimicrobiales bacterium]
MAAVVMMRALVGNYDKWRVAFDANASFREESGVTDVEIYCSPEDVNTLLVLEFFSSTPAAQQYASNPELVGSSLAGGVVGTPRVSVLTTD